MHCSACSTAVESTLRWVRASSPGLPGTLQRAACGLGAACLLPPADPAHSPHSPPGVAYLPAGCRALPGVASASVALLSESAEVAYDSSTLQEPAILAAIEAAGFEPRLVSSAPGAGAAGAGAAGPTGQVVGKLEVGGMHCSACSSAVEAALGGVPGVQIASVSLPLGQAEVVYNPAEAAEAQLVAAVEAAGFEARPLSQAGSNLQLLRIRGMTCAACASAAEAALCKVLGVQGAAVSLATGQVEVRYDPVATGPRHLVAAVEAAGFEAEALDARQPGGCGRFLRTPLGQLGGVIGAWRACGRMPNRCRE